MRARHARPFTVLVCMLVACGGGSSGSTDVDGGAPPEVDGGSKPPSSPPASGASDLAIEVPTATFVTPGAKRTLTVKITRTNLDAPVDLRIESLPASVTAQPTTIPAGANEGSIVLDASPSAVLLTSANAKVIAAGGGVTKEAAVVVRISGPPGSLDTTYGTAGATSLPFDAGTDMHDPRAAVSATGVVTVLGASSSAFRFVRLLANGAPDTAFGANGIHDFSTGSFTIPERLYGRSDGSVVAAGEIAGKIKLVRLAPDGSLDATFGAAGFADATGLASASFLGGGLAFDDAIAGAGTDGGGQALLRWNADGTRTAAIPTSSTFYETSAVEKDGARYVLSGITSVQSNEIFVARVANGALDPTFGDGGVVKLPAGYAFRTGLAVLADGSVLVATDRPCNVYRLTPAGKLDATFGKGGRAAPFVGSSTRCSVLGVQADGRIVMGGAFRLSSWVAAVMRLLPNGATDTSFGDGGKTLTSFPLKDGWISAMRLTTDGRIVAFVEHMTTDGSPAGFTTQRYWQ